MKEYTVYAHINSLDGKLDKITIISEYYVLGNKIPNKYICKYKEIKCLVLHNQFNFEYYADDIYSIID